jgi:ApbE superfamily uncharacterized protein (UPF0280 family)
MYEIWSADGQTHIVTIWAEDQSTADRIATALGGVAHYELSGVVRPE